MIRQIVFDMGNVLIHYRPQRYVQRLDVAEEDRPLLLREVFGSVEWIRLDRGSIGQEEAAAAMAARLPRRLEGAVQALLEWWKLELSPMEGMEALLGELKGLGCGLYLLSNATARLPEYFDRIPGRRLASAQAPARNIRDPVPGVRPPARRVLLCGRSEHQHRGGPLRRHGRHGL